MSAWKRLLAIEDKPDPEPPTPDDPWARAAASPQQAEDLAGFTRARRSRSSATAWLWVTRVAIGLVLVAGVMQVIVKPIKNALAREEEPPAAAAGIDLQAAGATAVAFAVDYLSSGGSALESQRSAALAQWLYPDAFPQVSDVGQWSGDGVLIADSASVQSTLQVGDDAAIVAVQARLRTYLPGEDAQAPPAPAKQESGAAAFVPYVPAGYSTGPAYWVRLAVPLIDSAHGPKVSEPGPIFTAEDLTPLSITLDTDREAASSVTDAVQTIFEAYGSGDLTYVAAEGSDLTGLAGTVSISGVDAIRASSAANGDGSRNISADLTWSLVGTDLAITQAYAFTVSDINSNAPQLLRVSVLQPTRPDHS